MREKERDCIESSCRNRVERGAACATSHALSTGTLVLACMCVCVTMRVLRAQSARTHMRCVHRRRPSMVAPYAHADGCDWRGRYDRGEYQSEPERIADHPLPCDVSVCQLPATAAKTIAKKKHKSPQKPFLSQKKHLSCVCVCVCVCVRPAASCAQQARSGVAAS